MRILHTIFLLNLICLYSYSQQVFFVDGYHGGIYGHYPVEWKTRFLVDEFQKNPEWRICLEIEPETWDTVQVRTPQDYLDFKKITTDKRVEFTNPTYAQPYAYNISGESLIRQFEYGIKKIRQHFPGVEFTTYSVEEPCFTSALPQILQQFGFKYAVLKNPNTCWGGYTRPYGGELVNWVGPDGTSILTVPRYACEGLEENSTWQTTAWGNSESYLQACLKSGIEHPVGMCFQDAGWKNGPWLGTGNAVKSNSTYVTWKEYIENFSIGKTNDDWHFTQEDILVNLMWGSQILQRIAQQVRTSENKIVMAEKLATLAHLENNYNCAQPKLDDAWRTLMLAQHHDSWIVPYNRLYKDRTWADEIKLWTDHTNALSDGIITEALQSFNRKLSPSSETGFIRIYNTQGTSRKEIASVVLPAEQYADKEFVLVNTSKEEIPYYMEKQGGAIKVSFQAEVPSFGYATYAIRDKKENKRNVSGVRFTAGNECILENDMYKITLDASKGGTIKSLIAKKEGNREFVDSATQFHFGELRGYFYETEAFRSSSERPAVIRVVEDNALQTSVQIEGEIASHPFIQTITIARGQKRIDCGLTINWKKNIGIGEYKQGDDWKDRRRAFCDDRFKLNILFPARLKSPELYKNAPFDVCKSQLENTFFNSWDSIKHNIILHWVDLVEPNEKYGMALLSDHTTSYSYGEDFPLGLTAQYSGIGLWGPDYKITEPLQMKYALIPHGGKWDKANIATESNCWNEPLVGTYYPSLDMTDKSLLGMSKPGYEISAAKCLENKILIRLFNAESDGTPQSITFGFPVSSVEEVDLNGQLVQVAGKDAGKNGITVAMPRFGLKTFMLTTDLTATEPAQEFMPVEYVNPFIGASTNVGDAGVYHGLGKTFPGATTPYGMVQVSPNTITGGDNGSGYSYEHQTIEGFAFTQMSGVGWFGELGNFLVMPTTGPLQKIAGKEDGSIKGYRSLYDKDSEKASAGYYSVKLSEYDIKVESSATPHCGILRFTYPENKQSRIQIDLARRVGGTSTRQYVKVLDGHTLKGWMECTPEGGGWGNGEGNANYTVYFYAELSKPLQDYGFWSADIPDNQVRKRDEVTGPDYLKRVSEASVIRNIQELTGKHLGFFADFPTRKGEEITLKVGISFVDMEGAEKNYKAEIAGKSFDQVKQEARDQWNKELSRIRISGGSDDEKTIFYTALYHTMIDPRIFADTDGRYTGGNGKIYHSDGTFTKRTIFSGWDVFRSQFPLQTIINPTLVNDELNSLITLADQTGREYYERWEIMNSYSGCMIGNPALSVLADAYVKGIRKYDIDKAYRYALNTSRKFGNDELGYTAVGFSISHTLEYAYTDWCISQLAKELGKEKDAAVFYQKGQAYRNIFDKEKGWFRPRKADGSWEPWPENARTKEWYGCVESNPYQQGWFVPHDVAGMVELMGGKKAVIDDLNTFFEKTPSNMLWNEYYNHANEPVHFVPFLFNQLDVPWYTQKWTRYICDNAYANKVEGIVGNEDVGQMSAWYVLTASGIHPSCPGNTRIEITSPVFDRIEFKLDPAWFTGGTFTIVAHNNNPENVYIQKALLNGAEYDKCYLDYSDIVSGGVLELYMGAEPNMNTSGSPDWAWIDFQRPEGINPIISPDPSTRFYCPLTEDSVAWESNDTFNPAATIYDGKVVVLYRAEDKFGEGIGQRTSRLGYASSEDGLHFKRKTTPVFYPDNDSQKELEWPGGCEDPRVAMTEDGMYVMFYTQWNRKLARLSVATSYDLLHWNKYGPAFAKAYNGRFFNDFCKSASIVTKLVDGKQVIAKINGKYWMYWGEQFVNVATSDDLINWTPMLDGNGELLKVMTTRPGKFDSALTECGPPAIMTDKGILLFYNGKNESGALGDTSYTANSYCAGQALFDLNDPTKLIGRLDKPFYVPEADFEKSGQYPAGTVFIEGLVYHNQKWFLYYGCADSRVAVAVYDPSSNHFQIGTTKISVPSSAITSSSS